jgi:hypothetical protein
VRHDRVVADELVPVGRRSEERDHVLAARALFDDPFRGAAGGAERIAAAGGERVVETAARRPQVVRNRLGDAAGQEDEDERLGDRVGACVGPDLADAQQLRAADADRACRLAGEQEDGPAVVVEVRIALLGERPALVPAVGELVARRLRVRVANGPEPPFELLALVRLLDREIGRTFGFGREQLDLG